MPSIALLLLAMAAASTTTAVQAQGSEEGLLNAKDFGCVGDGRTDDAKALQAAVDAAQSRGLPLLVPTGEYLLNSTIVIRADVSPKLLREVAARRKRGHHRQRQGRVARAHSTGGETRAPLRLVGDGIHSTVLVAGAPMQAVLSLPNISEHIEFSHFSVCGGKKLAKFGIDAPNTLIRSRFVGVGVNDTDVAGIRAAGWINRFEVSNDYRHFFISRASSSSQLVAVLWFQSRRWY